MIYDWELNLWTWIDKLIFIGIIVNPQYMEHSKYAINIYVTALPECYSSCA